MTIRLTDRAYQELERKFACQDEALKLLDLIVAEFKSDPMSTQCFDARIVQRAIKCVEDWKTLKDVF